MKPKLEIIYEVRFPYSGSGCKVSDIQFTKYSNVGAEHVPPS